MKKYILLIISLIIPQLAGLVGSIFTASSVNSWYMTLNKPSFNPPSWVFAPVWTTLFILMGIALYLVLLKGWNKKEVKIATGVFIFQLVLNVLWSFLFFGLQSPLLAVVEIGILAVVILINIYLFYRIRPLAGYLLIPYIVWVSFAKFLNLYIFLLN